MSRTTNLKALLYEVISEIGDVENIESYSFTKISNQNYEFETDQGDKVKVVFFIAPLSVLNVKDPNPKQTFTNVGFSISGSETQLKKSTYSYLIKIIKTVIDVILDYLKTNHPKYLFISATNKSDEKSSIEFDTQKNQLYQAIMLKNINKLPKYNGEWKYKILNGVLGMKGDSILLYNGN
jgi:hypothetical protein